MLAAGLEHCTGKAAYNLELQHTTVTTKVKIKMCSSSLEDAAWPRDFRMDPSTSARARFWSHELYRGTHNEPVRILYSRTKMQSEEIAHEFLGESVVGFDMEWPWQNRDQGAIPLQQRIGLIQIASEDKIALFHIGLHAGQTAKDVLAPSLRRIIESDDITKTGVGILNADFSRLRRWFGLKPRGAFELSHFHNLVTYGSRQPGKVTTKMKALSKLVEEHLGLPLYKGKVRTSNWSRPLNQAQILYAAADAYAGVMLYHCMNAKRLAMDPLPPLPLHAELYLPMRQGMGSIISLQLGSSSKDTNGISAAEFYDQSTGEQPLREEVTSRIGKDEGKLVEDEDRKEQEVVEQADCRQSGDQPASTASLVDPSTINEQAASRIEEEMELIFVGRRGRQVLLEQREIGPSAKATERQPEQSSPRHSRDTLCNQSKHLDVYRHTPINSTTTELLFQRLSAHRKHVAKERQCSPFVVAHNTLLSAISEKCPRNEQELRQIKGIGKVKAELYGPAWLAIVQSFLEEQVVAALSHKDDAISRSTLVMTPTTRQTQTGRSVNMTTFGHEDTPAVLHTGLSFRMENATLEAELDQTSVEIGDDSSAFGSPLRSPSPSTLKRKRELLDPSSVSQIKQRPALPQPAFESRRLAASTMRQPILQTTTNLSQPARGVKHVASPQKEVMPSPQAHSLHSAPKPMLYTHDAGPAAGPGAAPPPKTLASMEAQIFRKKLLAFNRRITSTVILSEATIDHIVQGPPQTAQELLRIPNILPFANACARQNQCLLTFILKSSKKSTQLV